MSSAGGAVIETSRLLAHARALHEAGRLEEAERFYRTILQRDATNVEALHLLGVLAGQRGETHAALLLLERAHELAPDRGDISNNLAVVYKACGRYADAETQFRAWTEAEPDRADGWNNLGTALHGQGRNEEAEACFRHALELDPRLGPARKNLATALQDQERWDEAESLYQALEEEGSQDPELFYNRSLLAMARSELEDAEAYARRAIKLQPAYPEAEVVLASTLEGQGRGAEAREIYANVHEQRVDDVSAQFRAGLAFRALGRWRDAVLAFNRVLQVNSDWIDALLPAAQALEAVHRYEIAERCCRRILQQDDSHRLASLTLASVIAQQGRYGEARATLKRWLAEAAEDTQVLTTAANVELNAGDTEAAERYISCALEAAPNSPAAVHMMGRVKSELGEFEEAERFTRRAWALQPNNLGAAYSLSGIKRFSDTEDPDLKMMQAWDERRKALPPTQRVSLDFALGKAYADLRDYDRAFSHYKAGNDAQRELIFYDAERQENTVRSVCACFTPGLLERYRGHGSQSETPVFIVGMPRSGTTLIEQVLASHPDVAAGGELKAVGELIPRFWPKGESGQYLGALAQASPDLVDQFAAQYLERIRELGAAALRVTDKMPGNFLNVGLIRLAFPNARIIYARRNPMDNCLSCYTTFFASGHEYSYDLGTLGAMYRLHEAVMEHWRALAGVDFLEVRYELMVDDLETQARRLVDYVGLPWDARCLEFYKTERAVATASLAQVRRPIYRSSVEKWRRYETHLGELAEALGDSVPAE